MALQMSLSRPQKLGATLAAISVFGFAVLGAVVGYSIEKDIQMHGVEPGWETTSELIQQAASGFALGGLGSALAFGLIALLTRYLVRKIANG